MCNYKCTNTKSLTFIPLTGGIYVSSPWIRVVSVCWAALTNRIWKHQCCTRFQEQALINWMLLLLSWNTLRLFSLETQPACHENPKSWEVNHPQLIASTTGHVHEPPHTFSPAELSVLWPQETASRNCPAEPSRHTELWEIITNCCFKSLSFGVAYCKAIDKKINIYNML